MSEDINILYVDDYPQDRALVRDALKESGEFHLTEAHSRESFEEALDQRDYDLVLSDFNILGFSGLDVIDAVHAGDADVPVVIVTGTGSEETAVEAMRRGAADYVIKSSAHIRRLPHTIRAVLETERLREEEEAAQRALRQAYEEGLRKQEALLSLTEDLRQEIVERERAEAALRESEARFRGAFVHAAVGMGLVGPDGRFISVNEMASRILGYTREEFLTMTFKEITHEDDVERSTEAYRKLLAGDYDNYTMEKRYRHKDGYVVWGQLNISLVRDMDGEPLYAVAQLHDVSDRKRAQAETRRLVHELQLLSRSATELISLSTEQEIYEYIGETLTALLDDAVIIINKHAPASQAMEIVGVHGLGTSLLQRAVTLLGGSPVGQTYPMLPEAWRFFQTGELEIFPGGLSRLGEGYAPRVALEKVEALLKIERTYLIGLTMGDDFYAGVQIYTRGQPAIEHPDLVQTFIRQASIALQQRRAEAALHRVSEQRRVILDLVPVGLTVTDDAGRILDANRVSEDLLGLSRAEHRERRYDGAEWDIVRPDGTPMPAQEYASVRALEDQQLVRNVEMGIVKADDEITWISVSATPIPLEGYGVAIAYADITDRVRIEEALEARVGQLDLLNEIGREIASELDFEALLHRATDLVRETFGYYQVVILTMEEDQRHLVVRAKTGGFADVIPEGHRQAVDEGLIGWAATQGESVLVNDVDSHPRYVNQYPDQVLTRSELSVPIAWRGAILGVLDLQSDRRDAFDEGDALIMETVAHQIAVAMNNARLYQAERAARRQLGELAGYLQEAREQERTRIARGVHDELGQMMTVLKMDLSWLSKRLPDDESRLTDRVQGMSDVVDEALKFARRVARDLRPGILDDLGLAAAIEWQADSFRERSDIACRLQLDEAAENLDRKLATVLFRILQEGLTNVARHAQATEVAIRLQVEPEEVTMVLEDDGRGISQEEVSRPESLGLLGMRERARGLGGELTVEGEPGQGTRVTARVPRPSA